MKEHIFKENKIFIVIDQRIMVKCISENDLDYPIIPMTHFPMYLMHKYWARKPANIVANYIQKYSRPGDIILDPFMGSGVTVLEGLYLGRKSIGVDINPISPFITRNTGKYVDLKSLEKDYRNLLDIVEFTDDLYKKLYAIQCPLCNSVAYLTHIIWAQNKDDQSSNRPKIEEIRFKCPNCQNQLFNRDTTETSPSFKCLKDQVLFQEQNAFTWAQQNSIHLREFSFKYENNKNFLQLRHNLRKEPQLSELFSHRAFVFLNYLIQLIDSIKFSDEKIRETLRFCFTSALGQASKMVWVIDKRKGNSLKKKQVGSWTHHFLWDPTNYFEVNALNCFKERFKKIMKGKINSNERSQNSLAYPFIEATNFKSLNQNSPVLLYQHTAKQIPIPDNSIDFIFTDPPYGDSIQYGELSSFWVPWLDFDQKNLKNPSTQDEIVINLNQSKDLDRYSQDLIEVFTELFRILKPQATMIVTFHNTSSNVRNALIRSVLVAGFDLKQILFQIPPRVSIKSMLHHSGSPIGDYYIRFQKSNDNEYKNSVKTEKTDKESIEILDNAMATILSARGEPTPLIWLSNLLDEYIYQTNHCLLNNLDKYFGILQQSGKYCVDSMNSWWFSDENLIHSASPSLTSRISQFLSTYLKKTANLSQKGSNTDKQILFNEIYREFNGILTPDKFSINQMIEQLFNKK